MPIREIAEAIGRGLKVPVVAMSPEEAVGHFGRLASFAGMDTPASSVLPQQRPGWRPTQKPGLIEDLDHAPASRDTKQLEPREFSKNNSALKMAAIRPRDSEAHWNLRDHNAPC